MKTRIISGAVAIVLLAGVLYFHDTLIFNTCISLIAALMVYELFKALKLGKEFVLESASLALVIVLPILADFLNIRDNLSIYFIIAFAYAVIYALSLLVGHKSVDMGDGSLAAFYTVIIAAAMTSLVLIEGCGGGLGVWHLVLTFLGAWFADTGAYFAGTFFGKHKLCPEISPKKTVEGLIGGIVSNALVFMLVGFMIFKFTDSADPNYLLLALMGVVCAVLGLIGDLLASLVKRRQGIKDYGNIMPGHGGALDRFDSVMFVAPFMAFCLLCLNVL